MNKVGIVARYEIKLLLRSRIFHLFAVFSIIVQAVVTTFLYMLPGSSNWIMRAIPSAIPFTAVVIFNALTAIGGILIVTEFLQRDLKLGSTDTIYYRDFPTLLYFLGKALGVILTILGLEALILLIPLGATIFSLTDTPVSFIGYLVYPILLTLPLIFFMSGVSWVLMLLTKSQPVTFVAGIVLFATALWLNSIPGLHHLFDYPGLRTPALYSTFIGFGDLGRVLVQRGIYTFAGIGLMAATAFMLPRLPQSMKFRRYTMMLVVAASTAACITIAVSIGDYVGAHSLRNDIRALNSEHVSDPQVTMTDCDLSVSHKGHKITVEASLQIANNTDTLLDSYLFSLNPALTVTSVTGANSTLSFKRNKHLLFVSPQSPLAPGLEDTLVITYSGTIQNDACYPDIPESERTTSKSILLMTHTNMYGCVTPEYVLLTPETLWYPQAGVPYGNAFPDMGRKNFTQFSVTVDTEPGLVPVTQGLPEQLPDGRTRFVPATLLPQLCLSIGAYEHKSAKVDSITYSLYCLEGHDRYTDVIKKSGDNLNEYLNSYIQMLEDEFMGTYPFEYLSFVEVPVQFAPPIRTWTVVQDYTQPGMMLVNERGLYQNDIQRAVESLQNNSQLAAERIDSMIFSLITSQAFIGNYGQILSPGITASSPLSVRSLLDFLGVYDRPISNILPNYYTFTNHYYSEKYSIINTMIEAYMALQDDLDTNYSESFRPTDTANMILSEHTMAEILSSDASSATKGLIMTVKLNQLFALFNASNSNNEFRDKLRQSFEENRFTSAPVDELFAFLMGDESYGIDTFIDEWYQATDLPACTFRSVSHTEITGSDRQYYQLKLTLDNPGTVDCLCKVFGLAIGTGTNGSTPPYERFERYVSIPAESSSCVCISSELPFSNDVTIQTIISQNLPGQFNITIPEPESVGTTAILDTVLTVAAVTPSPTTGTIIVDDIDPGFDIITEDNRSFFQKLLQPGRYDPMEFVPYTANNLKDNWTRTFDSNLYGDIVKSGWYKAAGTGGKPVTWHANLTETGTYDVYVSGWVSMNNRYMRGSNGERISTVGPLTYTITHDDGADTIVINPSGNRDTWIYLGAFQFPAGNASVELSDKSDGQLVYADAVKWVLR